MNYSKAHQNFSNRLQKPEALARPQDFLGPNYEKVCIFYLFQCLKTCDSLQTVHQTTHKEN
jgi:hypothetical protein